VSTQGVSPDSTNNSAPSFPRTVYLLNFGKL
jgi:hypothetical protein